MFNKKAAMFGLDARIALAIFGALSVITGAALFKTIQYAKTISFISQIEELSKAVESYRIDTGSLPLSEGTVNGFGNFSTSSKLKDIVDNSLSKEGWRGPYIRMDIRTNFFLTFDKYIIKISTIKDSVESSTLASNGLCNKTDGNCHIVLYITAPDADNKNSAIKVFNSIEEYIDGPLSNSSFRTGKVRLRQSLNTTSKYLDPLSGDPSLLYIIGPYPRNHL